MHGANMKFKYFLRDGTEEFEVALLACICVECSDVLVFWTFCHHCRPNTKFMN